MSAIQDQHTDTKRPFQSLLASKPGRTKGSYVATSVSIAAHAVVIIALVYMPVRAASALASEEAVLIPLAADPPLLPPPTVDVPRPVEAQPSVAAGFATLAIPDVVPTNIPLPQVGIQIRAENFEPTGIAGGGRDTTASGRGNNELIDAPFVTPMEVAPKLLNRDAVSSAVVRYYPPLMRDAGINGTARVWLYIDETGHSVKQMVKTSSGYAALDSAALRVAPEMRFAPAMTQARPVAVWVAIDIVFRVK
jgi:protein TonB